MAKKLTPDESANALEQKHRDALHHKHRQRVFQKIEEQGLDHLPEHEVMEYVLFFCIPRRDTNEIGHRLINRFGSFAGVLEASEQELCMVEGIGPSAARFLHALPALDRYYAVNKAKSGNRLKSTEARVQYLAPLFRNTKKERLFLLALDDRGKLLKQVLLDEGTVGSVQVNLKKIASEAMLAGASCVILAHNHPGGLQNPSKSDLFATGDVMRALGVLEIRVLDHIIFAGDEYYSMFDEQKLPFYNMKTGELRYF